jgi:hypothetical protein
VKELEGRADAVAATFKTRQVVNTLWALRRCAR